MISEELIGGLTLVLHLALAAGVTLHVLLTKRDVAASVSWIGIAWLSPVVGSGLYWLIGLNRVKRRAFRLRRRLAIKPPYADASAELTEAARHLEPLQIAGWRITGRRAEPGNRLDVLVLGDAAYPRMVAAIEGARQSIGLSTYILRAGIAGEQFVAALDAAQRRGVARRVLVARFGGRQFVRC